MYKKGNRACLAPYFLWETRERNTMPGGRVLETGTILTREQIVAGQGYPGILITDRPSKYPAYMPPETKTGLEFLDPKTLALIQSGTVANSDTTG